MSESEHKHTPEPLARYKQALQEITRLPHKPHPDPLAHSWQAYAMSVNSTYQQMRRIACAALSYEP